MDYKVLFYDVENWIHEANKAAMKYGMGDPAFWLWVADTTSAICKKYQDNRLVIMQMIMLVEWLEEVYENSRKQKVSS